MFPTYSLAIANAHQFLTARGFSILVPDFFRHGSIELYVTYLLRWFLAKSYYAPTVECAPLGIWQFPHGLFETIISDEVFLSVIALSFFPCCLSLHHLFFLTILFLSQIVIAGQALIQAFYEACHFLLIVLHSLIQDPSNSHILNAQILHKVLVPVYDVKHFNERLWYKFGLLLPFSRSWLAPGFDLVDVQLWSLSFLPGSILMP